MAIRYSQFDDADLVRLAQGGVSRAFDELTRRYQDRVYGLAYRILRHEDDAGEALQDAFLSAYRGLGAFRAEASFSSWLYRIATNASLMVLRKRRPNHISVDQAQGHQEDAPPVELRDWTAQPPELLLTAETREAMEEGFRRLPDGLGQVFVLRDIEGRTSAEVATILGLSVSAVKSRLHRCRIFLRDWMTRYFDDPGAHRRSIRTRQAGRELRACAPRMM